MIHRQLGRTGSQVSLAGLGTGEAFRLGQSAHLSAVESQRIVRVALDLGINLLDTAPAYRDDDLFDTIMVKYGLLKQAAEQAILPKPALPRGAFSSWPPCGPHCVDRLRPWRAFASSGDRDGWRISRTGNRTPWDWARSRVQC